MIIGSNGWGGVKYKINYKNTYLSHENMYNIITFIHYFFQKYKKRLFLKNKNK